MIPTAIEMSNGRCNVHHTSLQSQVQRNRLSGTSGRGLWKRRLAGLVNFPHREDVEEFVNTTVLKALRRVERELAKQDWPAEVHIDEANSRIYIEVVKEDQIDFIYEVRMLQHALPDYAFPEMVHDAESENYYYRAEVFLRRGGQSYDIYGFDQQDIINDILDQFEKHLNFLHISPTSLPWKMEEHDDLLTADKEQGDT